jgi:hypothetical protein
MMAPKADIKLDDAMRAHFVHVACFIILSTVSAVGVFAQSEDEDPVAVVEIGGAMDWNVAGGAAAFGPDFAVEVTPIENWLELEMGTSPTFTHSSTEWDTDLLFKKPWTLSRTAEFMCGLGPEWIHTRQGGKTSDSVGGEVIGDFMFWPTGKHVLGWYAEPGFSYDFGSGHQKSLGVAFGLLIGIR